MHKGDGGQSGLIQWEERQGREAQILHSPQLLDIKET